MNKEILELKIKLIAQEHRIWAIFHNLYKYIFSKDKKRRNASISAFVFNVLSSKTTAIIGLLGLAGYYFDHKNNQLVDTQNEIIYQQSNIADAERKGSLAILFEDLFNKIEAEINQSKDNSLSPELVAQIITLSNSLRPYNYTLKQNDPLKGFAFSAEKGHLLGVLSLTEINPKSLDEIYRSGNWKNCDLNGSNFTGAYLGNIDLSNSNLKETIFSDAILNRSTLNNCVIIETKFIEAKMNSARIKSNIYGANFDEADLISANFFDSKIDSTNFSRAYLMQTDFSEVTLTNSYFIDCDLENSTIHKCKSNSKEKIYNRINMNSSCSSRFKSNLRPKKENPIKFKIDSIYSNHNANYLQVNWIEKFYTKIDSAESNLTLIIKNEIPFKEAYR